MSIVFSGAERVFNVLFVGRDNSRLSLIAEALLREHGAPWLHSYSAGMEPAEQAEPFALSVLSLAGLDTGKLRPKHWSTFVDNDRSHIDAVVMIGDEVERSLPRTFPGRPEYISWRMPERTAGRGNHHSAWREVQSLRPMIDELVDDLRAMHDFDLSHHSPLPAE